MINDLKNVRDLKQGTLTVMFVFLAFFLLSHESDTEVYNIETRSLEIVLIDTDGNKYHIDSDAQTNDSVTEVIAKKKTKGIFYYFIVSLIQLGIYIALTVREYKLIDDGRLKY